MKFIQKKKQTVRQLRTHHLNTPYLRCQLAHLRWAAPDGTPQMWKAKHAIQQSKNSILPTTNQHFKHVTCTCVCVRVCFSKPPSHLGSHHFPHRESRNRACYDVRFETHELQITFRKTPPRKPSDHPYTVQRSLHAPTTAHVSHWTSIINNLLAFQIKTCV